MPESTDRVPISKRLVLINSFSTVATRVLTLGVFAWAIQYLVKRIPDDEMAMLPIAMSFAMALPLIQTILNAGLARHVTEAYARNDLRRVTQIVSSQIPWLVLGALLILIVGGLVTIYVDRIFPVPVEMVWKLQLMMAIITVRLAVGVVLAAFNCGMFATQRFVLANMLDVAGSLLRVALMLWLILGFGPEVHYIVIAQESSQLAVLLATTVVSRRLLPALRFDPSLISWEVSKEVFSFGVWYLMMQLAQVVRRASDAPLLYWLSTPVAVNTFFLGSFIELRIRELTNVAVSPLLPALTSMHAQGQHHRLGPAYLRGGRLALWGSLLVAVPLVLCSQDLYVLYLGDRFAEHADAPKVLVILLLAFPFTYPSLLLNQIVQAKAEMREYATATFVSQVANFLLTLLLLTQFGMGAIGAALSTLVMAVLTNVLWFWPIALRLLGVSWRRFVYECLVPGWAPAIISLAVGAIVLYMVDGSSLWRAVIGVSVSVVTYLIALYLCLQPADRHDIRAVLQGVGLLARKSSPSR